MTMEKNEILKQVNNIFIEVLDNEKIVLSLSTTAKDVEEWDSLTHIQLIVAIERHFKMRFTSKEIQSWKDVGEMIDCIKEKLGCC